MNRLAGRLEGNREKDTGGQKYKNLQEVENCFMEFVSAASG